MVSIWGKSVESWMQGMYFMFAVGAVISPLVTAPFLATKHTTVVTSPVDETAVTSLLNQYDVTTSRITLVYVINACLVLTAAALFFYQCIKNSIYLHGLSLPINDARPVRPLSRKEKVLVLLNMGILCLVYTAMEETFSEYLTTFCVTQMSMTKAEGSGATALFFAAFGLSRFLGIILVTQVNPVKLICFYVAILILSFVGITLAGAYMHTIGIWLFSPLVGVGMSIIYPILYTWTDEQFMPINGKIAAYLIILSAIGGMINPALLGYLIDQQTPMWFCYLLLGEVLLFLIFYDLGLIIARWVESRPNVHRLYNSEIELELINQNFGLDQRNEPSIGSFDTGLRANLRLSKVPAVKSKSAEPRKMTSITEDEDAAKKILTSDQPMTSAAAVEHGTSKTPVTSENPVTSAERVTSQTDTVQMRPKPSPDTPLTESKPNEPSKPDERPVELVGSITTGDDKQPEILTSDHIDESVTSPPGSGDTTGTTDDIPLNTDNIDQSVTSHSGDATGTTADIPNETTVDIPN